MMQQMLSCLQNVDSGQKDSCQNTNKPFCNYIKGRWLALLGAVFSVIFAAALKAGLLPPLHQAAASNGPAVRPGKNGKIPKTATYSYSVSWPAGRHLQNHGPLKAVPCHSAPVGDGQKQAWKQLENSSRPAGLQNCVVLGHAMGDENGKLLAKNIGLLSKQS